MVRSLGLIVSLCLFALALLPGSAGAQAGRLRVGLVTNGITAAKDPGTGELRGVGVELARALAARLGRQLELIDYPADPPRLAGLRAGAYDVTTAAIVPELSALLDFTSPFMEVDTTLLVPAGSAVQRSADANRPGVRVAAIQGGAAAVSLVALFPRTTIVPAATVPAAADLLKAGLADAVAANRQQLSAVAPGIPGSRILDDAFAVQRHAFGVPKGNPALFAEVSAFVEEARATGQVQAAITRTGVQGVRASPSTSAPTQLPRTGAPVGLAVALGTGLAALGLALRRGG
jgi:polar amino acid transport system substrate-binding protein